MCQSEIQRYGRSQGMNTNPHHELADFCIGIGSLLFGGKHLHPSVSDVCPNQKQPRNRNNEISVSSYRSGKVGLLPHHFGKVTCGRLIPNAIMVDISWEPQSKPTAVR